jgi:thioredoxin-like negative regulator of GroEL
MSELLFRIVIIAALGLLTWLLIWSGRRFVASRRQRALAAAPLAPSSQQETGRVRILAFSSDDCRQCHQLQEPALQRLLAQRGEAVSVEYIDAPTTPELTRHYQVLTVPTTVVLDATGKAHAINYGFANVQRLLEQVDAILTMSRERVS